MCAYRGRGHLEIRKTHFVNDDLWRDDDYIQASKATDGVVCSELRLTEALQDPHVCEKILKYNVHAEREGSLRYAKGRSETMSTLHGLRSVHHRPSSQLKIYSVKTAPFSTLDDVPR